MKFFYKFVYLFYDIKASLYCFINLFNIAEVDVPVKILKYIEFSFLFYLFSKLFILTAHYNVSSYFNKTYAKDLFVLFN